jgi:hypothetical protein
MNHPSNQSWQGKEGLSWRLTSDRGPWRQVAATRDLPTIAFSGPEALLRRSVPVPGILAAHRPGAIMDKSEHHFVARYP